MTARSFRNYRGRSCRNLLDFGRQFDARLFASEHKNLYESMLQVRRIRDLHFDAQLVTLSACDTGVGLVGEEGVDNVVNAFIEACASSVASTLWEREDFWIAKEAGDSDKKVVGKCAGLHRDSLSAVRRNDWRSRCNSAAFAWRSDADSWLVCSG
jgi:hypothetical protein